MNVSSIEAAEAAVGERTAVVTGPDEEIVELVKRAVADGRSVGFYLSYEQGRAVRDWYWTPERVEQTGLRPISAEEAERIRTKLGIEALDAFRFAPIQCECGRTYSAFDFFEQGVRAHGADMVNAVLSLKDATFFQSNPRFETVCPDCERRNLAGDDGGITYESRTYAGCSYQEPVHSP